MKPIVRNFQSVIRRYKLAATLNILGLSVAFAAFMVIMIQLNYDYGFDKCHTDYDKIFRVELTRKTSTQTLISRPLAERFIESSPHIVAGALTNFTESGSFFHVENKDERNFYKENSLTVTPEFFDVFSFDFVEGEKDVQLAPGSIFIPLSLSRKLFGNEPAVGKQIVYSNGGHETVRAVYRDFPANTIVKNRIYSAMRPNEDKQDWTTYNYQVYIRLNQASNAALLFENFKRNFDGQAAFGEDFDWDESGTGLRLTALPDIHFLTDAEWDRTPKASKPTLLILLSIAIVIIVIAAVNFTNFSTALTPMRVKSINTQKVLGARRNTIRSSLVFEAVVISLLSYIVAIWLISLFQATPPAKLVDADLSLVSHPLIIFGTALVALLTGLFAGLYPAYYITSFAPALVLKGSFGLSPKGKKMRNILIGIQFIASFALIIGASFMYLQNHFMQHSPLGYDKDELITVDIERIQGSRDAFTNRLKSYSGIEDVTYGRFLLANSDEMYMGWGHDYNEEREFYNVLPVTPTFLKMMNIGITEGRDFRQEDADKPSGVLVFNETARKKYNLEVGATISGCEIIGFMPDLKFASFRTTVEPMAFGVGRGRMDGSMNYAYIKVKAGADKREAMSYIRSTLSGLNPEYTFFEVRFFDEVLQQLYEKEISLSSLISLFSLLAIFISIVGVFGLVVFDSECQRKATGIRKIFGASTTGIILMFNKTYFRILLICFVVAAPPAGYAVHRWLQNFAYKTPMYGWVYLLAFAAVGIITVGTVTFQNWRVASENPVKAIKSE